MHFYENFIDLPICLQNWCPMLRYVPYGVLKYHKHRVDKLQSFKICGSHGGHYKECHLLGYKTPVLTSYVLRLATEPSRLMVCKIWGFHGGVYEECRYLGYKYPVRTSHETYYVSATEPNQLMLCKIWGFHGVTSKKTPFFKLRSYSKHLIQFLWKWL
jgi:hypothetical protein